MLFITSISPKHILGDRQQHCMNTMLEKGEVHSLNHPDEIEILKDRYPGVKFYPNYSTQKYLRENFKHFVRVNELFLHPLKIGYTGDVCIINSDIELSEQFDVSLLSAYAGKGLLYLHRYDYDNDKTKANRYTMGIDAMIIHTDLIDCLPQTMHCLGQTYWDIVFPWLFNQQGVQLFSIHKPLILHQRHKFQHGPPDWAYFGKHTGQIAGRDNFKPADVSTWLYKFLETATKIIA